MRLGKFLVRWTGRRAGTIKIGVGAGLRFDPGPSNAAYASGDNELPVQEALRQHVRPGAVFYDVGANVGFFTVIGARLVGPRGRVYAFEPVPDNAERVRRNAALNRLENVQVLQKAAAARSGSGELVLAAYAGGAALTTAAPPPDAIGRMVVDLVRLDDLVAAGSVQAPAVVKIDVEGAELDVLEGMPLIARRDRPVIVYELDDADADGLERKRVACERWLLAHGYAIAPLADSYPGNRWLVKHFIATPA